MEYYIKQLGILIDEYNRLFDKKSDYIQCIHNKFLVDCNSCLHYKNKYKNKKDKCENISDIKFILLELSGIVLIRNFGNPWCINICQGINKKAKMLYNEILNSSGEVFNNELANRNYYLEEENRKLKDKLNEIKSINLNI